MFTTDSIALRPDLFSLIAEIDRYAVDADFDTAFDDLRREFAERPHESQF